MLWSFTRPAVSSCLTKIISCNTKNTVTFIDLTGQVVRQTVMSMNSTQSTSYRRMVFRTAIRNCGCTLVDLQISTDTM